MIYPTDPPSPSGPKLSHAEGVAELLTKKINADYLPPLLLALKNPVLAAYLSAYVNLQIEKALKAAKPKDPRSI